MTEVHNEELSAKDLAAQEKEDFAAAFEGKDVPDRDDGADTVEGDDTVDAETVEAVEGDDSVEAEPLPLTQADIQRIREEAALEAEQRHMKRIRDLSGEVGGLRQKLQSMGTAKAAAENSGAEAPTSQQLKDAAQSGAKLEALKQDFPEFAEALEEAVAGIKTVNPDEVNESRQAAFEAQRRADETAAQLQRLSEIRQLDRVHPDWEQDISSPEYKEWLQSQSPELQTAAYESTSARDAITILNKFKAETTSRDELTADGRQHSKQRLEAAVTPTRGNTPQRRQPKTEHEEFLAAFGQQG